MRNCGDIFETEGTVRVLGGNLPLLLSDEEGAWLVESGEVDLFAVPMLDSRPTGARAHLCRAEAGQILLGTRRDPLDAVATKMVAVGTAGTRVRQLSRSRLQELSNDPELVDDLAALLDGWTQALTLGARGGVPPREFVALVGGQEAAIPAREAAAPLQGTVWVTQSCGASCFLGCEDLVLGPADGMFPLASPGWLVGQGDSRLTVRSTVAALGNPCWWTGMGCFLRIILARAGRNADAALAAERVRLDRKAEAERRLLRGMMSEFAAVARADDLPPASDAGELPLVAACRLVGDRLGIAVRAPRGPGGAGLRDDPMGAVARASRIRVRRVLLSADWWQRDNGPLLAFRGDLEHPVALLPIAPARYELVDPATGDREALTPALAATLQPFGYTFYRPLPSRRLGLGDVVRSGLIGSRGDLLAILALGLAGGLLGMLPAIVMGWIFDRIAPSSDRYELLAVVLVLAACSVAAILLRVRQGIAMLRTEARVESLIEAGVWDRLLNLPVSFFRRYTAGDLAMRAMGIATIRQVLTQVAWASLVSVLFSLVSFALLFAYDVRLAVIVAGIAAVLLVVTCASSLIQLRHQRNLYDLRGKIAGLVLQLITGISRLRVAGAEERALAVWGREFARQRRLEFRLHSVANGLAVFNASSPLVASMILYAAVSLLPGESLTLGTFLAFNAAFLQILFAAGMLSTAASSLLQVVPLYERARPIFETLPEVDPARAEPGDFRGEIEVNHVSFRFRPDSPLVLNDVSVHVRPGEFVAFVGPSGAGKSTLLRLLLGFENPTAGSIYYDHQELACLDMQAVRRQIGVVLQSGKLAPGDLFTNIVGSAPLTLDDAWEAARMSGLDDDIARMPMGMYTVVTEGESTLSGGQRQRLMIARAIATRPRILFFDEATSALDNTTQARVRQSLAELRATRVVVAHRLSTVLSADCIYVMEAGRIVQRGRYEELVASPGLFADLVKRQLS